MKIPQFLYVPRINTLGTPIKFIIETRQNLIWKVEEFPNQKTLKLSLKNVDLEGKCFAINVHKKYPFVLLNIQKSEITSERLVKLGNMASDWYAQFFLENKKLSIPKNVTNKEAYYYHWLWGNNFIRKDEPSYLINLEYGISIRFNYKDAFFASFEEFVNNIADIQFLSGIRPPQEEVQRILIDAWNYLGIEERLADNDNLDDITDDIYIEIKKFHSDRISKQMASQDNVIAIQGIKSIEFLKELLK